MSDGTSTNVAEMHAIYERFGKPLEAEYWGKYVAVARDGRTLVGDTVYEVSERSTELFGLGGYLFKIGERSIGKIRRTAASRVPASHMCRFASRSGRSRLIWKRYSTPASTVM